jgi:hypothetical protein
MSYYFEIKIKDILNTRVSIGFTNENFNNRAEIGHESNTYGYHSDCSFYYDSKWHNNSRVQELEAGFHGSYTMGDTVGAGVNYVTGKIFFTKNEKLVGLVPCNLKTTFYPSIAFYGCSWPDTKLTGNVEVNFKGPYIFDVNHYIQHSNLKTPRKWSLQPKLAFPSFFQ